MIEILTKSLRTAVLVTGLVVIMMMLIEVFNVSSSGRMFSGLRNRRFGQEIITKNILKNFTSIDDLIARIGEIGYLPEGAVACKYVHEIVEKHNLKLPISTGLYRVLNREIEPKDLLNELVGANR